MHKQINLFKDMIGKSLTYNLINDIPRNPSASQTAKATSSKIEYSSLRKTLINTNNSISNSDINRNNNNSIQNERAFKFRNDSQNSKNNNNNYLNNSNTTKDNSNLYATSNKYSYISLREENERLKITNQILLSSNSELKSENLNLNKELDLQYQLNRNSLADSALQHQQHTNKKNLLNNNLRSNSKIEEQAAELIAENKHIHLQLHNQYQELIDNLKASLDQAKKNNEELSFLIEQTQEKQSELQKDNLNLKEQRISGDKDVEKLSNAFEETKGLIKRQMAEAEGQETELCELRKVKRLLEEKLFLAEEQIINLISINDGHLKTKKDNLDCIESLRQTVDIIKRGGGSDEENILEVKIKLEEMENTINQKNYAIKNMSDSIMNFEKDREFFNLSLNNLREEIADKDKFAEELEEKYREVYADFEKANMRAETLQVKLDESEQTITNLKTSINFINETMEEYKQDYDKTKSELEAEKAEKFKMIKSIDITKEKFCDLTLEIEELQESKNTLQKKLLETEKLLKEKKAVLKKTNFDKSSLEQQLQEARYSVETLKEELKLDKYTKLNEEFQNEIAKSNEERLKKVEEIRSQLEAKSKEFERSQEAYSDSLKAKEDRIKELTKLLSKAESVNEQNDKVFNEKVFKLNKAIEQLKAEIQTCKFNAESEKRTLQYQAEESQRAVKDLQIRLKTSDENYSNLIKKGFGAASAQTSGSASSANTVQTYTYNSASASESNNNHVFRSNLDFNNYNLASNINNNVYFSESANVVAPVGSNFWSSLGSYGTGNTGTAAVSTPLSNLEKAGSTYYSSATPASAANLNLNTYSGSAALQNQQHMTFNAENNLGSTYKSSSNTAVATSQANSYGNDNAYFNSNTNAYANTNYDSQKLNFERLPKTVRFELDTGLPENSDIFNLGNGRLSNIKKKINTNTEEHDKFNLSDVNEFLSD